MGPGEPQRPAHHDKRGIMSGTTTTTVSFYIEIPGDRHAVLDRRDEIIEALAPLGIRLSLTDDGTEVYLVDAGVPTLGDVHSRR